MLSKLWSNKNPVNKQHLSESQSTLSPPDVPGLLPVQSVDERLGQHAGHLIQIDELAGLSNSHFNRFYCSAIRRFARFVQQLPASEVHHHAGPGGMLTHTLEVCVIALKLRRSYLLSETGGAEEISAKQDAWTYAVFLAALCHDLAKVAVDQKVTVYDIQHRASTWDPWNQYLDEQGTWYATEFVGNRSYRLHEKATPILIHKIIPAQGMSWLCSDRTIFSRWLACVSGDLDPASSLGEIVGMADRQSVAANLGADGSRMPAVHTIPLHEKMLTALRYLLIEGELPLNRNGAAGWICADNCWLVSKRAVDAIREQLNREGHSGIPGKNGRLFDVLQEQGVLLPCGDKAIWTASVEGEGWHHELTLIKIPVATIWSNPERRPDAFDGRIVPLQAPGMEDATRTKQGRNHAGFDTRSSVDTANTVNPTDSPDVAASEGHDDSKQAAVSCIETAQQIAQTDNHDKISASDVKQASNINGVNCEIADQFFDWLQHGIRTGDIKTNQAKARVHVVQEGVALMTPGIFQDFAKLQTNKLSNWTGIQKKVLKKNWHVRDDRGLNVLKYQVNGSSKSATVNVILFKEVTRVFGLSTPPNSNPHLNRM